MSYGFPQWVSAYTYAKLGGKLVPISGGGAAMPPALQNMQGETLLLRIRVSRDKKVERIPSFHHPAPEQRSIRCSSFTAELLDEKKDVLICQPLACNCDKGCQCWPKAASANIPWQPEARWLVIWEEDKKMYEEAIPDPPVLTIKNADSKNDGIHLSWSAKNSGKGKKAGGALWYIVHWYDEEMNVWRGIAPRQQETSLVISPALFVRPTMKIRVLGTSGIATGYAEKTLQLKGYKAGDYQILLSGYDPKSIESQMLPRAVLHAVAVNSAGRQMPNLSIVWYDNRGTELGRGGQFDTRPLGVGRHVVRAVWHDSQNQTVAGGWLIERRDQGTIVHHKILEQNLPLRQKAQSMNKT